MSISKDELLDLLTVTIKDMYTPHVVIKPNETVYKVYLGRSITKFTFSELAEKSMNCKSFIEHLYTKITEELKKCDIT